MHGHINEWKERYVISVSFGGEEDWADGLRKEREKVTAILRAISERWSQEKGKGFEDVFRDEALSWGPSYLMVYSKYIRDLVESNSLVPPPAAAVMITEAREHLRKAGIGQDDIPEKTQEFFHSEALWDVPSIRISSMLWAAIARKFAAGRKSPLNQGMANDVRMVSSLLPYCDAMFIDNECCG